MGAFHARVSDPVIGGTYITVCIFDVALLYYSNFDIQLLNTVYNLGYTWPRFFVLRGTVMLAMMIRTH
jgi:Acetyl-coenzyme A transporter 1